MKEEILELYDRYNRGELTDYEYTKEKLRLLNIMLGEQSEDLISYDTENC